MRHSDEQQFNAWVTRSSPRLHRVAFLLTGDWQAAEDALQESLASAARHWSRIAETGNPDAYVRQVLVNRVRRRWRRHSSRERAVAEPPTGSVSDGAQQRADRDELLEALRRLPARQRAAVVFRYFEQLTEAETAEALGCSIGTVKSQTHRALATLRSTIEAQEKAC